MFSLEDMINHIVLPPKLPDRQDANLHDIELALFCRVQEACDTLQDFLDPAHLVALSSVKSSLTVGFDLFKSHLEAEDVLESFNKLTPGSTFLYVVREQNAAVIISRPDSSSIEVGSDVVFEAFEISPPFADVLAAKDALIREFPGRAVELPLGDFADQPLRRNIANFLEQSCREQISHFSAHSSKASASVSESRDSVDPALVTQCLMGLLEGLGQPSAQLTIVKRVHDDVHISRAELPWRRSPLLLALRVVIQLHLCRSLGLAQGRNCYKLLGCALLAKLLDDVADTVPPGLSKLVQAKLCRRLAKLDADPDHVKILDSSRAYFESILDRSTGFRDEAWKAYKRTITRNVPKLRRYAQEQDLKLGLPRSGAYLTARLQDSDTRQQAAKCPASLPDLNEKLSKATEQAKKHFTLAQMENDVKLRNLDCFNTTLSRADSVLRLADAINTLFFLRNPLSLGPDLQSAFVLTVFDLWMEMDTIVGKACPLFLEYGTLFPPEMLNVLQLYEIVDMERVRKIQGYIADRLTACRTPRTILDVVDDGCFASRYVMTSLSMQQTRKTIQDKSDRSRAKKEVELQQACAKYDKHTEGSNTGICVCTYDRDGKRNVKGCTRCYHWRTRRKMKIKCHEDFLSQDEVRATTTVFELEIPKYVEVYRGVVWRIFRGLLYPSKPETSREAVILLGNYSPLAKWNQTKSTTLTLASEKKSFLQTHFKEQKMKANSSDVLLPNGLEFQYYDSSSGEWINDFNLPPTLQHLCGVYMPSWILGSAIDKKDHPSTEFQGLSSNAVIASQTKCPAGISNTEFTAVLRLLSSGKLRWMSILVEIGSSNMNFSSRHTMQVLTQLAVQIGPSADGDRPAGDLHQFLRDESFCIRLLDVLAPKLSNINSNWREPYCMALVITILLRLIEMSPRSVLGPALSALEQARTVTLKWIQTLREIIRQATDPVFVNMATGYGVWAALLCRRTFGHFIADSGMTKIELNTYVQASLALGEYSVIAVQDTLLQHFAAFDLKLAHRLRPLIVRSIHQYRDELESAIRLTWADASDTKNTSWVFMESPYENWVRSTFEQRFRERSTYHVIHYHFLEGYLLVNGKTMGRLPTEMSSSEEIRYLFGQQHLLTFPTSFNDMSYVLGTCVNNHKVYFGRRGNHSIIQALHPKSGLYELIPRRLFKDPHGFDLPSSLVDGCVHWLHLDSKKLVIRKQSHAWKTKDSDWVLDLSSGEAKRKRVRLISPQSNIFSTITRIFEPFEKAERITAFQPTRGNLCVELRNLDLSFFVNSHGLLESRELQSEIDPDQDAGTFYGLESKIVLRNVNNPRNRTVLTSTGSLSCRRDSIHVSVVAENDALYGRFEIDELLGRLTCAPEPRLIYLKARFHAYTSSVHPDPLTGRTGTEEAVYPSECDIRALCPGRCYYPEGSKRLQQVTWRDEVVPYMQNDNLDRAVSRIMKRSQEIATFVQNTGEIVCSEKDLGHLEDRAIRRRQRFERCVSSDDQPGVKDDRSYDGRDKQIHSDRGVEVYNIVKSIITEDFAVEDPSRLATALESFSVIGGFDNVSRPPPVTLSVILNLAELDFGQQWGSFARAMANERGSRKYDSIFQLSLLAFAPKADLKAVRALLPFVGLHQLRGIHWPLDGSFVGYRHEETPRRKHLVELMMKAYPEPLSRPGRRNRRQDDVENLHANRVADCKRLADFMLRQWPETLSTEDFESDHIDPEDALDRVAPEWDRMQRNLQLSSFVDQVQLVLHNYRGKMSLGKPRAWTQTEVSSAFLQTSTNTTIVPSLLGIATVEGVSIPITHSDPGALPGPDFESPKATSAAATPRPVQRKTEFSELDKILSRFTSSSDRVRHRYGADLTASLIALKSSKISQTKRNIPPTIAALEKNIAKVRKLSDSLSQDILNSLRACQPHSNWLCRGSLWPCTINTTLAELLRSSPISGVNKDLWDALVNHAVYLVTLQWLLRMQNALIGSNMKSLIEEWENPGHENWQPADHVDWLLMELESNIMIRAEQVVVAREVIYPKSKTNSVLQLNMGRGKTSCVMPMAATELANGKQLLRLIVPKALLLQTAQTLQSRIGGLAGRRLLHIPFSRKTKTPREVLHLYSRLYRESLQNGDIILTTPEHLMSFRLSARQRLADNALADAKSMTNLQEWFDQHCRDVLDESDLSLAVKTQLIYPSGTQSTVDGAAHRWKAVQSLLLMVEDQLHSMKKAFGARIEIVPRTTGFPLIFILDENAEEGFNKRMIKQIVESATSFLQITERHHIVKGAIKNMLDSKMFNEDDLKDSILPYVQDPVFARKTLLTFRGLLKHNILFHCLRKRFNVQFGLHPSRDPIAVPFEAKGVPSEQSEFGHPDVSIVLTCLAFYYQGLNAVQFQEGLASVLHADDPAYEYDKWTNGAAGLPDGLRHWSVINMDDKVQIQELWRHLRLHRNVLDSYMNEFVFPKHAKQFQVKLQASGWDLPNFSTTGDSGKTTGFSGTNDNSMLLPLPIRQNDLPELQQTSAEVLTYLLEPRNRGYRVAEVSPQGRRMTEKDLLSQLHKDKIKVFIDAGAYVMEMSNKDLVKAWMEIDWEAKAAVYFRDDGRAWVSYRGGREAPLLATPFAEKMEDCLVYLDENHTRGVDLKLPVDARGALTLALNQTKDHTVQAAMRLRKLGTTQSLVFIAPPEVATSIRSFCFPHQPRQMDINSSHVVWWLLEQTCRHNEQLQSLFVAQGTEFCRRYDCLAKNKDFLSNPEQRKDLLNELENPEVQSLEDMYLSKTEVDTRSRSKPSQPALQPFFEEIERRRISTDEHKFLSSPALEEVEQERQITHEVQEVRQIELPIHFKALSKKSLNAALVLFIQTGMLQENHNCQKAIEVMKRSSIGVKHGLCNSASSKLLVSNEFMRTVSPQAGRIPDNFIRPVELLLWCPETEIGVIISTEEGESLLSILQVQKRVKVHLLAYAAPVTRNMTHFSNLRYYSMPALPHSYVVPVWLRIQLGILAGRLYFDFDEYSVLMKVLVEDSKDQDSTLQLCPRPAQFLMEWLTLRRNGQDILNTPMGYLCQGRPLTEKHAFFASRERTSDVPVAPAPNMGGMDAEIDDDDTSSGSEPDSDEDEET